MKTLNPHVAKPFTILFFPIIFLALMAYGCSSSPEQEEKSLSVAYLAVNDGNAFTHQLKLDSRDLAKMAQSDQMPESFARLVENVHHHSFQHLFEQLDIPKEDQQSILENYAQQKEHILKLHFQDFANLKPSLVQTRKDVIIIDDYYETISDNLSEVISNHLCQIVDIAMGIGTAKATKYLTKEGYKYLVKKGKTPLKELSKVDLERIGEIEDMVDNAAFLSEDVIGYAIDDPCEWLLGQVMPDVTDFLRDVGMIKDLSNASIRFKEHLRKPIMELATVEDHISFAEERHFKKELGILWGAFNSNGSVSFEVDTRAKAGFKLDRSYTIKINEADRKIVIVLPQPQILSAETKIYYQDIEEGYLQEIKVAELNKIRDEVDLIVAERLEETKILSHAKANAQQVMEYLVMPYIAKYGFELEVTFEQSLS